MPVDCEENLTSFTDCLANMNAIIEDSGTEVTFVLGDFNAHPGSRFGTELLSFCDEHGLICADQASLGSDSDTYTFVDNYCLTALSIFVCGFGTLYIWMQCLITTYLSTLYYDKHLTNLRQYLANVSFLVLVVMAIFGTVTSILPKGGTRGVYVCLVVTSLCSYVLTAIFCVFILSFEKEYEYFSDGLRSEMLLDDACSLTSASFSDMDSIFGTQELNSSTIVIKGNMVSRKTS